MKKLEEAIVASLTPDLLKPLYREQNKTNPMFGHCYVASEAFYHLINEKDIFHPFHGKDESGIVHWWILDGHEKKFIDLTADQYYSVGLVPPYKNGRRGSFLTNDPSKRCHVVMERVVDMFGDRKSVV